ncbi:choline/carnitine O-acyltransferase [Paenibacillus sp.]|jgi:carnitine O-acetyltransferase|uniref:choline/carnitine O-acyltransferase n=1 Tax=Paenibacillus sp. TaxID=58172 RepID=UPI00282F6359|nr:choline/carnitine O-acyltransferase [Paenibacillus sp.]MDR0267968.1 choline/carnitine O-acyltransferase [Paenibacillus sp.]
MDNTNKYTTQLRPLLKKLPVPPLQDSLTTLVEWVEPLLTVEQQNEFKQSVLRFQQDEGPQLQQQLEQHAAAGADSWLAPWWLESYLTTRGNLQSETNIALTIHPNDHAHMGDRAHKAAVLIERAVSIYLQLISGRYPLEQTPKGAAVDMSYYRNIFKSCRLPAHGEDEFYVGTDTAENNFVVIIRNSHFYKLMVTDERGDVIPAAQLEGNLRYILTHNVPAATVAVESAADSKRELSADVYEQLQQNPVNAEHLRTIHDAIFAIGFSDDAVVSTAEQLHHALLGWRNQWFAKTTQMLIDANGTISFNFEHSSIDGVPVLNVLNQLFTKQDGQQEEQASQQESSSELVTEMRWQLDEHVQSLLAQCSEQAQAEYDNHYVAHVSFERFGKSLMKRGKVSPDAFFHIALALAQYESTGQLRSVYEPVAMRHYYQGRTECARSISSEKKAFVESFMHEYKQGDEHWQSRRQQLVDSFQHAAAAHSDRIKACQLGAGIERHLFGLKRINQLTQASPSQSDYFFQSQGLKALTEDFISTTSIPYEVMESFTFAPVNSEGFGLYYGILNERIVLDISVKQTNKEAADQLLDRLCTNLERLAALLELS